MNLTPIHNRRALRLASLACVLLWSGGCDRSDGEAAQAAYRASVDAMRARDYPAAVEFARQATRADPASAAAWLQLGTVHSRLRQWNESIAAYERAIELKPQDRRAANNLANVYFRRGMYEQAETWYGRALEIDPDYLLATFHHGWVLRQLNRLDQAERAFAHCKQIAPKNDRERSTQVDCHFNLGAIRFRQGDYTTAARVMEEIVSLRPGHPEARHFLGRAYRHLGRMDEAARQLEIHRQMLRAGRAATIPEPEN